MHSMIEEDEWTDHPTLREWQDATDLEAAKVASPLLDDHFDHAFSPRTQRALDDVDKFIEHAARQLW